MTHVSIESVMKNVTESGLLTHRILNLEMSHVDALAAASAYIASVQGNSNRRWHRISSVTRMSLPAAPMD